MERVKPHPEPYLRCLAELGVAAEEAVALEDTPTGAVAALEAGIRTYVYPNELTKAMAFPSAAVLVENPQELIPLFLE